MLPTHRPPTHPGEMLLKEFLEPLGVSQVEAATRMSIPFQRLNGIVRGRRAVSADTALLLEALTGWDAQIWLTLQANGICGTRCAPAAVGRRSDRCARPHRASADQAGFALDTNSPNCARKRRSRSKTAQASARRLPTLFEGDTVCEGDLMLSGRRRFADRANTYPARSRPRRKALPTLPSPMIPALDFMSFPFVRGAELPHPRSPRHVGRRTNPVLHLQVSCPTRHICVWVEK